MSNGSTNGNATASQASMQLEALTAIYKELREGNRFQKHLLDKPKPMLNESSGHITIDAGVSGDTDALGNAPFGSATANLINYPSEDWNACCKGDPPTGASLTLNVDYDVVEFPPPHLTAGDSIETAFMTISWGAVGHHMDVDLVRGFSMPISGQRVIVKIGYPIDRSDDEIVQPGLVVRGSVGLGGADGNPGISGCVRRTIRYGLIQPDLPSVILPIPPWATAVAFQGTDIAIPTIEYRQLPNNSNAGIPVSVATIGKGDANTVPIAAGARFAQFFNPNEEAIVVRAIYYLSV